MDFFKKAYRAFNRGCDRLIGDKISRMVVVLFFATAILVGLSELHVALKAITTILVIARIFWLESQVSDNQKNRSWKVALAKKTPFTIAFIWISTVGFWWKTGVIAIVVIRVFQLEWQKTKK